MSEYEPEHQDMRRSGRFEQGDSLRIFYSQVVDYLLQEFQVEPEMVQELHDFLGYTQLMQQIVPPTYPHREDMVQFIHHAIDVMAMPALPPALPNPSDRFAVGEHMVVSVGYEAHDCWPDKNVNMLKLDDNTIVQPRTLLGKIDIVRNLPHLEDKDGAVVKFARHLMQSSASSLVELARSAESSNSRLSTVAVYGGVSHLARIAGKLHFSVYPIADSRSKAEYTNISLGVARHVVGDVEAWKEMVKRYKPAEVAFISRESLIEHFGRQAVARGFQSPDR